MIQKVIKPRKVTTLKIFKILTKLDSLPNLKYLLKMILILSSIVIPIFIMPMFTLYLVDFFDFLIKSLSIFK